MTIVHDVSTPDFDSALCAVPDPADNATALTVTLRLAFTAIDAQIARDLSGKVFKARPWTDGEVRQYIADFRAAAESQWTDRIYILLPDPAKPLEALPKADYLRFLHPALGSRKQPYLRCGLRILAVDKNPHARVNIVNIEPGQGRFQARVYRRPGATDDAVQGSDALQLTEHRPTTRDTYRQVPAVHEIGHLLGLEHVNAESPACRADPNAELCYGGNAYEMNDIMGMGDAVTGQHAHTWLKAIRLHTLHDKGWTASHLSPPLLELMEN